MQNAECKMQNDRKRLIELIVNAPKIPILINGIASGKVYQTAEHIADHLIASGLGFVDNVRRDCGSLLAAKDIIINDLNEDNNRLRKENSMFWKKRMPIAVENERCPVCGTMVFVADRAYCRCCGQALKFEACSTETDRPGDRSLPDDDTEIGMIKNINDRT